MPRRARPTSIALLFAGLVCAGCSTGSSAEREPAPSTSGDETRSAESEDSKSTRSSAPNPSEPEEAGDGAPSCTIREKDWKSIDFQDATDLHHQFSKASDYFAPCLKPLPPGEKFYLAFEVEAGRVTGAKPAPLSKNLTRRLSDADRKKLSECANAKVRERKFLGENTGSYTVTHPFCTE